MTIESTLDNVAAVVMRAQPPHHGHLYLIREALQVAPRVIVVLGSAFQARTTRNPFTAPEREAMISLCLTEAERSRVSYLYVRDYYDRRRWADEVRKQVAAAGGRNVTLVGFEKDGTSAYLRDFPQWRRIEVRPFRKIDATTIREAIFASSSEAALAATADLMAQPVIDFLRAHLRRPEWGRLRLERKKLQAEADLWGHAPHNYERFVLCADSIVQWEDQIILIRRGDGIGEGLLALPGGHVDKGETTLPAAMRELREEVGLGFMDEDLEHALQGQAFLEAPQRSQRPGRVLSMAYHFVIKSRSRPEVRAGSDARAVLWAKIPDLPALEDQFLDDHFMAIDQFLKVTA